MDYLDQIGTCGNIDDLYRISMEFIRQKFQDYRFCLYRHFLKESPFRLVQDSGLDFDERVFSEWASSKNKQPDKNAGHYVYQDFVFLPIGRRECSFDFHLLIFDQLLSVELLALIRAWSRVDSVIRHSTHADHAEEFEEQGELVSQLLHDMQSIISLTNMDSQSAELKARLIYQQKASAELLFYIRDVDLITTFVPVKELISSSLELVTADWKKINLSMSADLFKILIDAELFSVAFKNILQNSITATGGQLEKIFISVSKSTSHSPFIPFDWIKIEVRDEGSGIHEDYFDFIRKPFFTAGKQAGSIGFGLTNAEKIITAHTGFITIRSAPNTGTRVQIFLPEKL